MLNVLTFFHYGTGETHRRYWRNSQMVLQEKWSLVIHMNTASIGSPSPPRLADKAPLSCWQTKLAAQFYENWTKQWSPAMMSQQMVFEASTKMSITWKYSRSQRPYCSWILFCSSWKTIKRSHDFLLIIFAPIARPGVFVARSTMFAGLASRNWTQYVMTIMNSRCHAIKMFIVQTDPLPFFSFKRHIRRAPEKVPCHIRRARGRHALSSPASPPPVWDPYRPSAETCPKGGFSG